MPRIPCSVMDLKNKESEIGDIPIVREFSDVFLENLPRLPSDREVEFSIDLLPSTALFLRHRIEWHPLS